MVSEHIILGAPLGNTHLRALTIRLKEGTPQHCDPDCLHVFMVFEAIDELTTVLLHVGQSLASYGCAHAARVCMCFPWFHIFWKIIEPCVVWITWSHMHPLAKLIRRKWRHIDPLVVRCSSTNWLLHVFPMLLPFVFMKTPFVVISSHSVCIMRGCCNAAGFLLF
jgi:hypothetical protein